MSKKYENTKKHRQKIKQYMVESMGSKCQICSYNKHIGILEFHHIDPNQKDFDISHMSRVNSWNVIVQELKKCILLCNRCHREIHLGIAILPNKYAKFNDKYSESIKHKKQPETPCKICGTLKNYRRIYCSHSCAVKGSPPTARINWNSIDIIDLIENQQYTLQKIADLLFCTKQAVRYHYQLIKNFTPT